MTEPAAFRATYSDFKLIKGRKVIQFIFEVPIEESNKAYEVLGGMPNPAAEVWCAIARLSMEVPAQKPPPDSLDSDKEGARRLFARVGIMCRDPEFHRFLEKLFRGARGTFNEEGAADYVRQQCFVVTRREIIPGSKAAELFERLERDFELWKVAPRG